MIQPLPLDLPVLENHNKGKASLQPLSESILAFTSEMRLAGKSKGKESIDRGFVIELMPQNAGAARFGFVLV